MTLTVHHLHASQSERVTWLCQELGIDYELKTYSRTPLLAPPEYKALHSQGTAPVIQDGDLTLAESGACIEYICHKHASPTSKLFLQSNHPSYADFLYWWHWANGTLQPTILQLQAIRFLHLDAGHVISKIAHQKVSEALQAMNNRLQKNKWLAGDEFTVADIMVVFTLSTMRYFCPYSLQGYDSLLRFLGDVGQREAYQAAMKRSDPGMEPVLGAEPPAKPAAQAI